MNGAGMPTDPSTDRITGPLRAGFTFTGQRAGPANYVGSLMDYFARAYSPALGHNACPQPVKVGDAGPYNTLSGLVNAVCPRTTYSKLPWGLPQGRIAALS